MKYKNNLHVIALTSIVTILLLIFFSSTTMASATNTTVNISAGPYAYVANENDGLIYKLDISNDTVVDTIQNVGSHPCEIAFTSDGKKGYVTQAPGNSVYIFDTLTKNVTGKIDIPAQELRAITITPDGKRAYVTNPQDQKITILNITNNTVIGSIDNISTPYGIVITPDGKRAYVSRNDRGISIIDLSNNTVIGSINNIFTYYALGIAISPDGTKVFAPAYYIGMGDYFKIISTANNTVIGDIGIDVNGVGDIAITPDGTKAYLTEWYSQDIAVIDLSTNTLIKRISGMNYPCGIEFCPIAASNPTIPLITWNNPADITYGTPLSDTQLNAVATDPVTSNSVSGTFIYNQEVGTILDVGVHTLHVDFSPTDKVNYTTVSMDVPINVLEQPEVVTPVANFSSNVTVGSIPLSVKFTDQSRNATAWNWNFGDGYTSTEQNPTHVYSVAGNYNVTLTVNNSDGSNTLTNNNYINATKPEDEIIGGYAPFTAKFTDLSVDATSWKWNFGDGVNSTEQNPTHTYTEPGQYTVTLVVSNEAGKNTATRIGYISVGYSLRPPVVAFSASTTFGKAPLNVSFIDASTESPTTWNWNFGDGTNSAEQNPVHIYDKQGQYNVTLTASNAAGSSAVTKLRYISVGNSLNAPIAAFSASAAS